MIRAQIDAEDNRSEKAIVRAARSLLFGKRLNPDLAYKYVDVLSMICLLHGTMLDNAAVAPADPEHFTYVDAAFEARGLKDRISMIHLVFGGPPIDVPFDNGDFPSIGHMSPEAVKAARGLIGTRDWSGVSREVRDTVQLVDHWIAEAAFRGQGLVCFYS